MDDSRFFDDLPERVWRSPEAQLVKMLTDFENANGKINGPIAVLSDMQENLPSAINRIAEGLKLVLDFTKVFDENETRQSLNDALAAGNLEVVKQIAQIGGETADSWTLQEIAKLEILKRQQQHLAKITQQLSACQSLFNAMFAVIIGARIGSDYSGMVLDFFDQPIPEGGPNTKYIDHETPIFTVILGIQETLQNLGRAIAAIPDIDFPKKIKDISPSELGMELQHISASSVVRRINSQTGEVAKQLGLLG